MGLLLKKGGVQKAFSAKTYIIKIGFSEDSATGIPLRSAFKQILRCFNGWMARTATYTLERNTCFCLLHSYTRRERFAIFIKKGDGIHYA